MPVRVAFLVAAGALFVACHRDDPKPAASKQEFERLKREVEKRLAEQKLRARSSAEPMRGPNAARAAEPEDEALPEAPRPRAQAPRGDSPFVADIPVELAPPAQATATARGVVLETREGEVVVARLGRLPHGGPSKTPVEALPATAGPFTLGRGPSLGNGYVYFISHGTLVRRSLPAHGPAGALEVLARDAFDGTRVATPISVPGKTPATMPETVSYIVRPAKEDGPLLAKLWVEGQSPELLTAEGNSTHSVALVHTDDGVLAFSVQARMAMTPVHVRRIRFASGHPLLGDDTVVWVGGGIQPLTEMTLLPTGDKGLAGLIPHERSMKEFGLARLDIGMNPTMDTPTTWMLYPNGIDPAPVAAARVCGEPAFLYAAPEKAAPDSPQELLLRAMSDASGARALRLSSGRAFYFASIAEVPGGALSVWVTDAGTFACTVRCTTRQK
jgi:hypothetical protein